MLRNTPIARLKFESFVETGSNFYNLLFNAAVLL